MNLINRVMKKENFTFTSQYIGEWSSERNINIKIITMKKENLNYGEALEALKLGERVARIGWNGKGMFIFKQIHADIGLDIIPKMTSVPQKVKDFMVKSETTLKYRNQMVIVDSGGYVNNWVASSSDTYANDWCIL